MSKQDLMYTHIYNTYTNLTGGTYWDKGSLGYLNELYSILHDSHVRDHHRCHIPQGERTGQWSRLPALRPIWGTWASCWWHMLACLTPSLFCCSSSLGDSPSCLYLSLSSRCLWLVGGVQKVACGFELAAGFGRPMTREIIKVGTVTPPVALYL